MTYADETRRLKTLVQSITERKQFAFGIREKVNARTAAATRVVHRPVELLNPVNTALRHNRDLCLRGYHVYHLVTALRWLRDGKAQADRATQQHQSKPPRKAIDLTKWAKSAAAKTWRKSRQPR